MPISRLRFASLGVAMGIVRGRKASAVVLRPGADRFLRTCTDERVKRSAEDMLDLLKERYDLGTKIPRSLFPPPYIEKWGLNNLYKCDLALGWRLTYTLTSDAAGIRVDVLEIMPHPEYDKRFGYRTT
jgi:hypothetical protein